MYILWIAILGEVGLPVRIIVWDDKVKFDNGVEKEVT